VNMDIENRSTFENALKSNINLFLGAGFSLFSSDQNNKPLPTAVDLTRELCEVFHKPYTAKTDLARLYIVINSTDSDKLRKYLKERFTISKFDERYLSLDKIATDTIFTTNIDNLLQKVFGRSTRKYLNDLDFHGPVYNDKSAIDLVMLHGSVINDRKPFRFGKTEISSSFENEPVRWRDLQDRLQRNSILFWGYSVEDPATLQALAESVARNSGDKKHWIILHPKAVEDIEYYRALHFQIIISDTDEFLNYLSSEFTGDSSKVTVAIKTNTKSLFPGETIPSPSELSTFRPIEHFLRGAAPEWSDIYSPILYKVSHYITLREAIFAKQQVAIAGVPASGKSTLLMQLASDIPFEGHKIMIPTLTEAKADSLIRKIGNDPALIFIDNFTDDATAFDKLGTSKNIQVVGADRDYNINNAWHLFNRRRFKIVDVTGLSKEDMYGLRKNLPETIKLTELIEPDTTGQVKPSIFEFLDANLKAPKLRDRVLGAMQDLAKESPYLAEMLLFVSYVHHCSTPVSMDMALGYWRSNGFDYSKVYDMIKKIGSSIAEYEGILADKEQDYFVTRSTLVADTVIDASSANNLKSMLKKFHKNLSVYSICRYDIFARRGYENALILKAFDNWEEGLKFYAELHKKDSTPYTLQHAALYLSKKNHHKEAFYYIEKAKAEAGTFNWTIRNSYAVILFKANIGGTGKASRQALDESMNTLKECYTSDRRKGFHVIIFAENAIQYWNKYGDQVAKNYLLEAKEWTEDVKSKEIWPRGLERVQHTINQLLR
jgi:hypothetical protein